jgi:hypothetical protein
VADLGRKLDRHLDRAVSSPTPRRPSVPDHTPVDVGSIITAVAKSDGAQAHINELRVEYKALERCVTSSQEEYSRLSIRHWIDV